MESAQDSKASFLNMYKCTTDQELAYAAAEACALTVTLWLFARQQHFSIRNNIMAAVLEV